MGIITNSGRAAAAKAVKEQTLYLAWGTGGSDWSAEAPPEDELSTGLRNEVGRKALFRSLFVHPDDDGEITISEHGRYAVSTEPTPYLFLEFEFDFRDGAGETIRELGIFMGGKIKDGLPPGQSYFIPAEVEEPGTLFMLEHRETALERTTSERCHIAYVIPF